MAPAVEIDEVPGGLDKGIGSISWKKLKKRKQQTGVLQDSPSKLNTDFNVEAKANKYLFLYHVTSSSK